eukprot:9277541-Alexandrium_andersonii.AAC.1
MEGASPSERDRPRCHDRSLSRQALVPRATGKAWLFYQERPEGQVKPYIESHAELLRKLKQIAPNLAFTQEDVHAVLGEVLDSEIAASR